MSNDLVALDVVRRRLSEVLCIDEITIDPDSVLLALPGADSLRLVEVVVRVEDDLGVSLLDMEEGLLKVRTVADLARLTTGTNQ